MDALDIVRLMLLRRLHNMSTNIGPVWAIKCECQRTVNRQIMTIVTLFDSFKILRQNVDAFTLAAFDEFE